jgi:signal transduction histidine kinase
MTRILLVEDNLAVIESISFELEMRGYEVLKAMNGLEALSVLERVPVLPDIIVSDIAMPDMDGYQFLEKIQKHDVWSTIPFIFLTAFGSPNAQRIGKELGADDYLVKPFQPDDLVVAMENKLKRVKAFRSGATRQALDDVERIRQQFLDMVSHELRTPLTLVRGGLDILSENIESIPDREMLRLADVGAQRLSRLVDQLTLILHIDSGQAREQVNELGTEFDLRTSVRSAWGKLEEELGDRADQVWLRMALPDEPVVVYGTPDLVETAISEILRNAVAYGGEEPHIDVRIQQGDEIALTVTDRGDGIAAEHQPRLFERFMQVNRDVNEQQGAGLGLSLARDLARVHGGDCTVESALGRGTTVRWWLPAV